MLFTSMYYTRAEQPSRISAWYLFNGIGVAGGQSRYTPTIFVVLPNSIVASAGGLIGYGIGHIKGAMASWRLEFLIVGAVCAAWGVVIALTLANSPLTSRWFNKEEKLMMLARMRRNQTGIEAKQIKWGQVREAVTDYKTVCHIARPDVTRQTLKLNRHSPTVDVLRIGFGRKRSQRWYQ
jgi:hypothetical protein